MKWCSIFILYFRGNIIVVILGRRQQAQVQSKSRSKIESKIANEDMDISGRKQPLETWYWLFNQSAASKLKIYRGYQIKGTWHYKVQHVALSKGWKIHVARSNMQKNVEGSNVTNDDFDQERWEFDSNTVLRQEEVIFDMLAAHCCKVEFD